MNLKEYLWPDCHLCRALRASLCAGLIIVLATYAAQLLALNREERVAPSHLAARPAAPSLPRAGQDGYHQESEHAYAKLP